MPSHSLSSSSLSTFPSIFIFPTGKPLTELANWIPAITVAFESEIEAQFCFKDRGIEEEAQVSKIQELPTESDSETAQFCFEEETIEEVMRQFYNELSSSIVAPPQKPSSPPHITNTADNNGSCGASVSDSNSTVMAGIKLATSAECYSKKPTCRVG